MLTYNIITNYENNTDYQMGTEELMADSIVSFGWRDNGSKLHLWLMLEWSGPVHPFHHYLTIHPVTRVTAGATTAGIELHALMGINE